MTYAELQRLLKTKRRAVCTDPPKALAYAKKVKALAQKALDEASDVLEDTITSVS